MLVREVITDAKTGETTERWIEMPDVVTAEAQAVVDAQNRQTEQTSNTNRLTLEQQAIQALADNKVFYSRASSTTAQVLAQVKALSRQNNGLIRLLLKRLDAAD